ncbi:MAG TPA: hypothetical protein VHN38_06750, partial [Immundisolibacter sp.]|nr:hypothetical protein [Immundisolibacter sp.]
SSRSKAALLPGIFRWQAPRNPGWTCSASLKQAAAMSSPTARPVGIKIDPDLEERVKRLADARAAKLAGLAPQDP